MIYISCSDYSYDAICRILAVSERCPFGANCSDCDNICILCWQKHIKRINTDITPDKPDYSTEAENTAYLQGFNVAVKKMRGEG